MSTVAVYPHMQGYTRPRAYLSTQGVFTQTANFHFQCLHTILSGPLPQTVVDFWRLVWQERAPSIVMITNLEERGKTKCQQYWPDLGTENFGPFQVSITNQQILADYTIRNLTVQVLGMSCEYV